jgi:hypothetical protein
MPKRLLWKRLLLFASVLTFAVGIHQIAYAWTWAHWVTVYNGTGLCVQGEAGIDHVKPGTFSGNLAYSGTYARAQGCGAGLNLPDGWAATRLDVFKWTGSAWAFCRGTNWKFGATGVNQWGPWGPEEVFNYGGVGSCGRGWYGTTASVYVWDGGAWRGGGVWSGNEFVQ